jgi:uncharacterized protein YdeI (YjbR/CyaY-like superfamily)
MPTLEPHDVTHFATPARSRAWLEEHHAEREVLWLGYWKKATGRATITWEESVDVALCFGWIDGIRKRVDDAAYTVRFTPRRPGSIWSRRNIERYTILLEEGRIAAAGAEAFARRREERSGLYSFEQEEPPELSAEYEARLRRDAAAWADWEARPPGYRRQVAHWVMSARRESTRERRLAALIEDCAAGRKVKPLR